MIVYILKRFSTEVLNELSEVEMFKIKAFRYFYELVMNEVITNIGFLRFGRRDSEEAVQT